MSGGTVANNTASNFTIYIRNSAGSPNIGTIAGRRSGGTTSGNQSNMVTLADWNWTLFGGTQRRWNHNFNLQVG